MKRYFLALALVLLVSWPDVTSAQFAGLNSGLSLDVSPRYPEPGEVVTVSLNDFSLQGSTNQISWAIDGVAQSAATNQRSIQFRAGDIGETTAVRATLYTSDGQVLPVSSSVTASRLTLVVEPYTTTPFWYQGRALPTVGSQVRVVALPQTGTTASADSYTYTWRLNDTVLNGGGVRGQFANVITMPYGRSATLTVDASDQNGKTVAQRSVSIPSVEAEVYFYELNPLRGLSRLAITPQTPLVGSEMTVRAEAFYVGGGTQDELEYQWKIDGRQVDNPADDPQTITFQNGGGIGNFRIDFAIRSTRNLLQGAENYFNIVF